MKLSLFQQRWGVRLVVFLGLLLLLFVLRRGFFWHPTVSSGSVSAPSTVALHTNWQAQVRSVLERYDRDAKPDVARDTLLGLTVDRADQATHLALVLGFQAMVQGVPDAPTKLAEARQAFEASTH